MTRISRREALAGGLLLAGTTFPVAARAMILPNAQEVLPLWPAGAPGGERVIVTEEVVERPQPQGLRDRIARGVRVPTLTTFLPRDRARAGVLVIPGGGYKHVVLDKEGYETAHWLASQGFATFVLRYRLPGDGWAAGPDVALSDAQRAMRLIRHRVRDYGILPERVAAMGFSAGGHVCGDLATRFAAATYRPVDAADKLTARPDIAAPIYAVQSMTPPLAHAGSRELLIGRDAPAALERAHTPALNVTKGTPPCFLAHAEDDPTVPVENSLEMRASLKAAGVPVETHLFTSGGHGFGLRRAMGKPAEVWPELFLHWAQTQGLG